MQSGINMLHVRRYVNDITCTGLVAMDILLKSSSKREVSSISSSRRLDRVVLP